MKKIYLAVLLAFFSVLNAGAVGILIMKDQGTECTRTRLADFSTQQLASIEPTSYFRAYSERLDNISVEHQDVYAQCKGTMYYPVVIPNSDKAFSTYLFLEYVGEEWQAGNYVVSKILKIEVFSEPPYKYKSITYQDIDQENDTKQIVEDFIRSSLDNSQPPPLYEEVFEDFGDQSSCFNRPMLFKIKELDVSSLGNDDLKIIYEHNNQVPKHIRSNWIEIHNKINLPIIVFVWDEKETDLEELAGFDRLAVRYILTNKRRIEVLGMPNVTDAYVLYRGKENTLRFPSHLASAEQLTRLKIAGLPNVDTLVVPEAILRLPNLVTVEIQKKSLFQEREFYLTADKYFEITRLDTNGCLLEKKKGVE